MSSKTRAPRNRTLQVSEKEKEELIGDLVQLSGAVLESEIENRLAIGDALTSLEFLPDEFADLIIIDPPYNLNKSFGEWNFKKKSIEEYSDYLDSWFRHLPRLLKPEGSIYVCCDWFTSTSIHQVALKYFEIQNRITWEREKGRGALRNWKNASEDIWFLTKGKNYYFNVEAVKLKRKVIAPYRQNGQPKGWEETESGNFRLTYPSNFWNDITVPYWSMPENTDHPTQKPEKLLAKLILASSRENSMVFDPFVGSGSTAVTAFKLGRRFFGIDINETYLSWGVKRLQNAKYDKSIQGYSAGCFWERNSLQFQDKSISTFEGLSLFNET